MSILTKFKDLTIESLKDNKKLIVGLYIIFIICFIIGWIYSAPTAESVITKANSTANTASVGQGVSAIDLLINNEIGGIVTYIGSIFFAIPAIFFLIYNGVNIGAMGPLMAAASNTNGINYIIYLIPHGIFELTATVLESVAGILLFIFIWRFIKAWISRKDRSSAYDETKKILIQSIAIFIFSAILIVIAAPIEAYFSVPFSEFIMGLL